MHRFVILFAVILGLVLGLPLEPIRHRNSTHQVEEEQDKQVKAVAALIAEGPKDPVFQPGAHSIVVEKVPSRSSAHSLLETGSIQEIQTIRDYLEQLKSDIRKGASSYVQDSVAMMEELTTAIKDLKKKIEVTVDRVNSKAESKLLAIKAIEELIGFSAGGKNFVEKKGSRPDIRNTKKNSTIGSSLLEIRSVQEIQTIKDYLEQLKTDIRSGVSSYVQDSVSMMEELTTAIKNLKKKIEGTVNRVNSKAESKLLAIKAIEELIGFSKQAKSLVEYTQTISRGIRTPKEKITVNEKK